MGLSASFKTVWSRELQEKLWTENVWRPQANFRLESELKDGDRIKRIIPSKMVPRDYTRYTDLTLQQGTTTGEELVVDKTPSVPFEISDLDELQSTPKSRVAFTDMAVEQLNNIINGWYLAEVTNAGSIIDASHVGGTASQGIDLTVNNIDKVFAIAMKKLGRKNVLRYKAGQSPFFANLTPDMFQVLLERIAGRESILGDKLLENGHAGMYMGFDLYVHNGAYWTGDLYLPTQPTDGDTMVIEVGDQTITLTFKSTVDAGVTAGQVKIASTVDLTRANLAASINAPGTTVADATNAGFNALSSEQQAALYGCTATNDNSTDKLTLTWRGAGAPIVSETFTSANNIFSTGLNISHNMFGKKGAVDFVIQRAPNIQVDRMEKRIEEYSIKPYTLFGKKTFTDGARKLINVKVNTTLYV
jgi:hypothetical protein